MAQSWTSAEMEKRLVRYDDLIPCRNAFVDTYTPGSDQKENFTIIGPGVAENPNQHVHIKESHGFNIGGARQPPGCVNSQHSHLTEEVFIVHKGRWAFRSGENGEDGEVILEEGDCISLPVNVFRGFENVGTEEGYLFAVLGRDDPGRVTWAPDVFEKASEYGLVLLEDGGLVDTTIGDSIPDHKSVQQPTTPEEVASHRRLSSDEISQCVVPAAAQRVGDTSGLSDYGFGVTEKPIIGAKNPAEKIGAAKLSWPHGFCLRRIDLEPKGFVDLHSRNEEEVLYIHRGELVFEWGDQKLKIGEGDVLSVPIGLVHGFSNPSTRSTIVYAVRGDNFPAAAQWETNEVKANV